MKRKISNLILYGIPKKYRKRRTRKRRTTRKRGSKMTRWGISTYNIHKYKRYGRGFSLPLSDNPAGFDAIALQFQLNQVVAFSDFVALYDQYKITYIQCKISWSPKQSLPVSVNEPAQSSYPLLYSYKDYDDSQTPLNLAEMKERGNLIQTRLNPNKIISIGLKPATLNATYSTPLLTVSNLNGVLLLM